LNEGADNTIVIRQKQVSVQLGRTRSPDGQADRQADVVFKSFRSANVTIEGIELMHMIKKSQMVSGCCEILSAAEQLYSLAD
jgi:transposase-like protein